MTNLKKNKVLEKIRQRTPEETKVYVRKSYEIADRIYAILKEQNKDQKFLADKLGKSESEISKWLSGAHNFTIKTLTIIEVALNESIIFIKKEDKVIEQLGEPIYLNVFALSEPCSMNLTFSGNYISSEEKQINKLSEFSSHKLSEAKLLE